MSHMMVLFEEKP